MAKEGFEDRALLPSGDQGFLLVRVFDGCGNGFASIATQVTLDEGVQARDGAEDGAPSSGTLFVRVEGIAVAFLRPTTLGRAQVQTGLVVLGADSAFWLAIVARLVVYMAEVAAKTGVSYRAGLGQQWT